MRVRRHPLCSKEGQLHIQTLQQQRKWQNLEFSLSCFTSKLACGYRLSSSRLIFTGELEPREKLASPMFEAPFSPQIYVQQFKMYAKHDSTLLASRSFIDPFVIAFHYSSCRRCCEIQSELIDGHPQTLLNGEQASPASLPMQSGTVIFFLGGEGEGRGD